MDSLDSLERLPEIPEIPAVQPGLIRRISRLPGHIIRKTGRGIRSVYRAILYVLVWIWYEFGYWFRLFLYTSRRFLRIEMYLSLLGALWFFGWILTNNRADNMNHLLHYGYIYFTVVMVLLCMNLLPRERDENTLEIIWSQPMRRGPMIAMQLTTVSIWVFALSVFVVLFFGYFGSYSEGRMIAILFLLTTSFTVGAITVLVSTLCLHGIATGLVTLLILGTHFYWLSPLGPIDLFYNPIPLPGYQTRPMMMGSLIFNRVITLVLAGFALDYLFRRLRQTAKWFT